MSEEQPKHSAEPENTVPVPEAYATAPEQPAEDSVSNTVESQAEGPITPPESTEPATPTTEKQLEEAEQSIEDEKVEIIDRALIPAEREGYLANEVVMVIESGTKRKIGRARIEDSPQSVAVPGGTATYRGGIWFEDSSSSIEEIKATCAQQNISFVTLKLTEGASEAAITQNLVDVARGYISGVEKVREEYQKEAERVRQFVFDIMRRNRENPTHGGIQREMGRLLREGYIMAEVAAINQLLRGLHGGFDEEGTNPAYEILHIPFYSLIAIFAAKDILQQQAAYQLALESDGIPVRDKINIPESKIFTGAKLAEVGGDYIRQFAEMGATIAFQRRIYDFTEFGGIKNNEVQVTLDNYRDLYPDNYDVSLSHHVMDIGSGVGTGFGGGSHGDHAGSVNLLAVFANMTRPDGVTAHRGNYVPTAPALLEHLGLEYVFKFPIPDRIGRLAQPLHVFRKIDDRIIKPDEFKKLLELSE